MAWSIVGVGTVAETTGTTLTLTEPAGVADGDLLIACISSRTTSTTGITCPNWVLAGQRNTNNVLTTTSAAASACMLHRVRSGTPSLSFTLPAGISVAMGRIVAYRTDTGTPALDLSNNGATAINTTAVSLTGVVSTVANELIVSMMAGGQEATWSNFRATTPATGSGATDTTTAPSTTAWFERADSISTTGAQTSLGIFDAVKATAGSTGSTLVTASQGAVQTVVTSAFKAVVAGTADAWNLNDKSSTVTLSVVDKKATTTSAASAGTRSSTVRLNGVAGAFYAEFLIDNTIGGTAPQIGIRSTIGLPSASTPSSVTVAGNIGNILLNPGGLIGSIGSVAFANGDVLCVAWNSGTERVWFRLNGGLWNNDASANPATGINGLDVSALEGIYFGLWFSAAATSTAVTVRTELAEFTQAVPSGFTSWMGEAPPTADAWNVNDKSANITLSASDKTATTTSVTTSGVRSTATVTNGTAGKWYAEIATGGASSVFSRLGITPTSNTLIALTTNFFVATFDGAVVVNGSTVGGVGAAITASDTVCIAWDSGAELVWFRRNGGSWNNSGSADPATGTGGFDCSFAAATPHALWGRAGNTDVFAAIRTEAAEFTQSGPAGFTSWMGEALGPTAYTLPAAAGTYALTGTAATPKLARFLDAATAGSYALTGTDATLTKSVAAVAYNLPADAGSYALTGAIAGLYRGREVLALPATYALSGATAFLERGREVAADPSSYALTGATASLELGREVLALGGSYAVTGATATLWHGWKVAAVAGSYTLTGTAATLTVGAAIVHRTIAADAGTYALTGATTSLELGKEVLALAGSYALTGQTASLEYGREVLGLAGSYALTGTAATFLRTWKTAAVAGSYGLSGQAATFRRTWYATAVGGTYALTGLPVNLLKPGAYAVIGLPGSYALAGSVASLEWNRKLDALAGSYALSGTAASLEKGREVAADAGSYALTGSTATLTHAVARTVVAGGGAYALTGSPAVLTYSGAAPAAYRSIAGTTYASRPLETVVDAPAGVIDGDILIAGIFAGKAGDFVSEAIEIEITPPAGWTQIGTDTEVAGGGFVGTLQVYWKRASGEPSSYSFAHTGPVTTYSTQGLIAAYSGCVATGNPVDVFSQTAASTGSTALAVGVAPEYTLTKLVYLGHNWDATGALAPPSGTTERFDNLLYLSDEDRSGSGRTGDRTQTLASSNPWAAFLVALKSATSVFTRLVDAVSGSYALTGAEDVILEKTTTGVVSTRSGVYRITGEPAVVARGLFAHGGVYTLAGATAELEIGVEVVEPPVVPIVGGGGGTIPKKQLRKAVRELLRREEKRKGKKKPKVLAREILEAVEAKGLGVREKRIAIRLIGEALRLELPSLFYSQPLIHDKERIARAILFLVQQAMQRLLDEEEDEEAALLLLSAA